MFLSPTWGIAAQSLRIKAPLWHCCCRDWKLSTEHTQIEKDSRSFEEVFADQRDRLVYLTADSEQEVETLSTDDIYIIGKLPCLGSSRTLCTWQHH